MPYSTWPLRPGVLATTFMVSFEFKLGHDQLSLPLFHTLWPFHFVRK